jgi:hypothetical protein
MPIVMVSPASLSKVHFIVSLSSPSSSTTAELDSIKAVCLGLRVMSMIQISTGATHVLTCVLHIPTPTNPPTDRPANQPTHPPTHQSINRPANQPTDPPIQPPTHTTTNPPIDMPTKQRPTNRPANRPTDPPIQLPTHPTTNPPQNSLHRRISALFYSAQNGAQFRLLPASFW